MGRGLIQMERPVDDVDMGTETAFKFLLKFCDNFQKHFRRDGLFHRADLVQRFFRAGLVIFQQVLYSAVAFRVPGFLVPGILGVHMVGIMLGVIHPLNFLKAVIRSPESHGW